MCEYCISTADAPTRLDPALMSAVHERNIRDAQARGIPIDQYLLADVRVSPTSRFVAWLENLWMNIKLLKPGL